MGIPERFRFTADFWENGVLLNQSKKFQTNELLMECFTASFKEGELHDSIIEAVDAMCELLPNLEDYRDLEDADRYDLEENLTNEMILRFDSGVRRLARAIETIDQFELSLPPYNRLYEGSEPEYCDRVFQALEKYPLLWKRPDYLSPYVIRETASRKYLPFPLMQPWSYPSSFFYEEGEYGRIKQNIYAVPIVDFHHLVMELHDIIRERQRFLFHYMDCVDIMRNLLDKYINVSGHFQNETERSEAIQRYEDENPDLRLSKILTSDMRVRARVIVQDGKPLFTESYEFQDAVSFFFVDLMRGLKSNYVPKRCANCGKWFLITGGKYLEYCSNPLENDPSKTCRDIGAQEIYAQKCRNDPVWQTYTRAYKTHFARRTKGKMTPDEFRIWADNAILWRGQAERGELDFDTYYSLIRK